MFANLIKRENTLLLILLAFITIVPLSVNVGMFLGSWLLLPYVSVGSVQLIATLSAVTAGLLMTQQNFYYFLSGKLVSPRFYACAFILCLVTLSATLLASTATTEIALFALLLVPCALYMGGVVLRDYDLQRFRLWLLVLSFFLFVSGITLFITHTVWLQATFYVSMCAFFFCRTLLTSNHLIRSIRQNPDLTEQQWRWLVLKIIKDTIFAYIIIFTDITGIFKL